MWQAHYLQEKAGAYLSRHGRLAGLPKAAAFDSEGSAHLCLQLWMGHLQKRWGAALRIDVEKSTYPGGMTHEAELDAATLLARARARRFASNQQISPDAVQAARLELARLQNN